MVLSMVSLASITFAQDLDAIKAGVVKILNKTGQVGTGFIVRVEPEMLYIITAAHVIAGDPQPEVEFFIGRNRTIKNVPVEGSVLPGAQLSDDLRGLALVVVQGQEKIPRNVRGLSLQSSTALVSGREETLVIGHPGGIAGDWAALDRNIANRVGHDISFEPTVASRFSGGPIVLNGEIVGIVMSESGKFGLALSHKSILNYLDGMGIETQSGIGRNNGGFNRAVDTNKVSPPSTVPQTKTGKDGAPMVLVSAGAFTMGSPEGEGDADEHPEHEVYLKDFLHRPICSHGGTIPAV